MHFDMDHWKDFQVDYPESSVGAFSIEHFTIDEFDEKRLSIIHSDGVNRDPGCGEFRRLVETSLGIGFDGANREVWMSDTRAEILEHMPFISKIPVINPERILVNGLGLGLVVHAALKSPQVRHIDVVEHNPQVIELVGPLLNGNGRVTVHHGDAYDMTWPDGTHWDMAWHDIWPTIDDENLPGMKKLRSRYRKAVDWQGFWQMKGCLKMAKIIRQLTDKTLSYETAREIVSGKLEI